MSADSFGLGLRRGVVKLVAHNPAWSEAYDAEVALLSRALSGWPVAFEHVGSTAIPGIRAKPILDLMIGIPELDMGPLLEPAMISAGYDFARHVAIPEEHVFGKGGERTHLVHVVERDGSRWHRYLRFRDRLCADAVLAREYDALKGVLATRFDNDRVAYTEAKAAFIDRVVA